METVSYPEEIVFDPSISAMLADGDDIWIGSRSGDIARYSLPSDAGTLWCAGRESLAIRAVQQISAEGEHIWFLSYGAVGVYSRRQNKYFALDIPDRKSFAGFKVP